MRRPTLTSLLVLALLVTAGAGCADDGPTTTTTTSAPAPSTTAEDAALAALLLRASELPDGFTIADDVNDTITAFCASEDATAGLHATARAVRGFTRTASGASVIQVAFRFEGGDAARFVTQAGEILGRCSGVPDITGLAFEYDALSPELEAVIDGATESSVGRHGINVGSGSLSIDVVVLQHGDVGQLVAVLGLDLPRAELDALAAATFRAVVARI